MGKAEIVLSCCVIMGEPVMWGGDLPVVVTAQMAPALPGSWLCPAAPHCAVQEQGKFWANGAVKGKHCSVVLQGGLSGQAVLLYLAALQNWVPGPPGPSAQFGSVCVTWTPSASVHSTNSNECSWCALFKAIRQQTRHFSEMRNYKGIIEPWPFS